MAKIVMKFGGTSVADLDRIRHVATLVKREVDRLGLVTKTDEGRMLTAAGVAHLNQTNSTST